MDTTTILPPETEERLRRQMEATYANAREASAQYREVIKVYIKDPMVLSIIESYSDARAKEILALRSLEGCGWR
jgi:hypothetical protein